MCGRASLRRIVVGLALVVVGVAAALMDGSAVGAQASRTPVGRLDPVRVLGPGSVRVTGWATDPDTTGAIPVIVAANGRLAGGRAALARADLPRGRNRHGYSFTFSGLGPGAVQVCAGAFNVGPGEPGRLVGCQTVDTGGGSSPLGTIDAAVATGAETVRLTGWALDPDTAFPTPVDVLVDGVAVTRVVAADPRADVAAAYPGLGPWHGYTAEIRVTPGPHLICLRPQNLGGGTTRLVGCTAYTTPDVWPRGTIDALSVAGDRISVAGWAFEGDQSSPPTLTVSDEGPTPDDPTIRTVVPSAPRPDAATALGTSQHVGYAATWAPTVAGPHRVCVAATNRGWGSDRLLGCRTIVVEDRRPTGALDVVSAGTNSVTVRGWAADPDGTGPVAVRVTSDRGPSTTGSTGLARPDVAAAVPFAGPTSGYAVTLGGLVTGSHRICVEVDDRSGSTPGVAGDRQWCGGAIVGSDLRIAHAGAVLDEAAVGPGPTNALGDVDRDGGVSVTLRDGSVLWLFGDSSARDASGALRYFVSGTAAWAPPSEPGVTRDGSVAGRPVLALAPGPGAPDCGAERPARALWPMSAVAVPDGSRDRVIAWFAEMCLGPQPSFEARGTAVATWTYDPGAPPIGQPISFTLLRHGLWSTPSYGEAAVVGDDGRILTYSCDGPEQGGWFDQYGPCTVARVEPDEVDDPAAYRFWNGSGWSADPADAAPMTMPAPGSGGVGRYPPAAFTVAFDAAVGRWAMAYTSWPGFTEVGWLRFATSPLGPWSEPLRVDLPGCGATIGGELRSCYAMTLQTWRSTAGRLGLGFYRMWLSTDLWRGGYRSAVLGIAVGP